MVASYWLCWAVLHQPFPACLARSILSPSAHPCESGSKVTNYFGRVRDLRGPAHGCHGALSSQCSQVEQWDDARFSAPELDPLQQSQLQISTLWNSLSSRAQLCGTASAPDFNPEEQPLPQTSALWNSLSSRVKPCGADSAPDWNSLSSGSQPCGTAWTADLTAQHMKHFASPLQRPKEHKIKHGRFERHEIRCPAACVCSYVFKSLSVHLWKHNKLTFNIYDKV